jgi:arginase
MRSPTAPTLGRSRETTRCELLQHHCRRYLVSGSSPSSVCSQVPTFITLLARVAAPPPRHYWPVALSSWAAVTRIDPVGTTGLDRAQQRPLTVIGAATSAGAYGPGQERAPEYLRAHGLVDAHTSRPVRDAGNVVDFVHRPDPEHPQAANVEQVREAALSVAAAVSDAYTRGEDALVLGGDCTIELATVAGALADGSSVGLIYIDLDGDLNTPATGDGVLDWMGLAHILGIDGVEPRLADAGPRTPLLPPQAVYLLAADRLTEPERRVVQQLDIRREPLAVVRTDLDAVLDRLLTWASAFDRILIHIDIDVLHYPSFPIAHAASPSTSCTCSPAESARSRNGQASPSAKSTLITPRMSPGSSPVWSYSFATPSSACPDARKRVGLRTPGLAQGVVACGHVEGQTGRTGHRACS